MYNYIDNLIVTDARTQEKIDVKVTVDLDNSSGKDGSESAHTRYSWRTSNGNSKYVEYNGLEGENKTTPGPINSNDEIGFDITLFSTEEWSDNYLANEAGDVMFRMEYPNAAYASGSDADKKYSSGGTNWEKYLKKGSAGYYSQKVEDTYKMRKKSGSGKDPNNNPYPLIND